MKWTLINICEFDKYAVKSYCAIHNASSELNLGDITKVDENSIDDFDMIVGGSPCQDFSVAGNQEGAKWICQDCNHKYNPLTVHYSKRYKCPKCDCENIDKTRSSLLVEWLRVINGKKPKFAIYENVKNIVGAEFLNSTFKLFTEELNEYGYNVYWKVLNAKNYGIPQNRERVFAIIIRKDIYKGYTFPQPFYKKMSIKDIKLDVVDEKYYLSDKAFEYISSEERIKKKFTQIDGDIAICLTAVGNANWTGDFLSVEQVGNIVDSGNWDNPQRGRIYSADGCSPALNTCGGGGNKVKIVDEQILIRWRNTEKLLGKEPICVEFRTDELRMFDDNLMGTLRTIADCGNKGIIEINQRIRNLTPQECFRLMGFDDADYHQAQAVNSDSQLYKQCGNSIVVNVLYYIFKKLQERYAEHFEDLRVSSFFSGLGAFEVALDRLQNGWEEPIEAKEIQEQISLF